MIPKKDTLEDTLKKYQVQVEMLQTLAEINFSLLRQNNGNMHMFNRPSSLQELLKANHLSHSITMSLNDEISSTKFYRYQEYTMYDLTIYDKTYLGEKPNRIELSTNIFFPDADGRLVVNQLFLPQMIKEKLEVVVYYQDLIANYDIYKQKAKDLRTEMEARIEKELPSEFQPRFVY